MLVTYEKISGQSINYNKSRMFFSSNVDEETKLNVAHIFGVYQPSNTGKLFRVAFSSGQE